MIQEIIHFLLMVLASVCGILLGAALVDAWGKIKNRCRRSKGRNRR